MKLSYVNKLFQIVHTDLLSVQVLNDSQAFCSRNPQKMHLHHYRHANSFAEVHFLQPLIDSVASNCIGGIVSFCNATKRTTDARGLSYRHTKAIAGLLYRCEGVKETLQGICQFQSLTTPVRLFTPNASSGLVVGSPKRRVSAEDLGSARKKRRRDNGTNTAVRSPINRNGLTSPSVLERLGNDNERKASSGEEDLFSGDDYNSMLGSDDDDDDDSFGVIGDWGGHN